MNEAGDKTLTLSEQHIHAHSYANTNWIRFTGSQTPTGKFASQPKQAPREQCELVYSKKRQKGRSV
jgi:hypothetical protein